MKRSSEFSSTPSNRTAQPKKFAEFSIEQALLRSRAEFRAIERLLLTSNPRSSAAVLLSQLQLLLGRLELGFAVTRGATLSLLVVAGEVRDRTEATHG